MKVFLMIAGILQLGLAVVHLAFPRHFGWKDETSRMSRLNQQIFYVHTFFVCLVLVMFGLLSIGFADELLGRQPLARAVCTGISFFWLCRLGAQLFVYDTALWRGKLFETTVHIAFTLLWILLTAVYAAIAMDVPAQASQ